MTVYYTLTQAAAATGKHKSTILRALQSDKVPSNKDVHGNYRIEADGLHAVYPQVRNDAEPLRNDSAPVIERNDATDASLHNDAEASRTVAELETEQAISDQKTEQIADLRATVTDLQSRLDQAEADRRQLEADRRQADENATRQVDQLSQLLAMKEKAMQTMQIEHQAAEQGTRRSWWRW